jgi:tRNA dimethylallyltransferase
MNTVIVLLGPTGIGKTRASLLLARHLDTEIISADSMLVYRHMDIGTAKPTRQERSAVRHHMIDIVDPWQRYSTGEYVSHVVPIIDGLHALGRVPLIVGGTGLYIKALTRGIFSGPSADWDLRAELLNDEQASPGSLYARLRLLDAEAAERISPADIRRIVRALEVCLKTDVRISQMHREQTRPMPCRFIKIGLTRQRSELYRNIDERVDAMIGEGLVAEVIEVSVLIERHFSEGGSPAPARGTPPLPSMQAIGYKEIASHLAGSLNFEETVRLIKKRSRNYAKRQFTWFGKEPGISWVDVTGISEPGPVVERILAVLDRA